MSRFGAPDQEELTEQLLGEGPRAPRTRVLIIFRGAEGPGALQLYRDLPAGAGLSVGRARECDIHCDDGAVSRRHAIFRGGSPPTIEDLGSANGTRVGGERISPGHAAPLVDGAIVEIGPVLIVVQHGQDEASKGSAAGSAVLSRAASPMDEVHRLSAIVAKSTISVILLGETGVGKDVLATRIHAESPRSARPFVRVNCAALPEHLLESELFGYERGAFTGATQRKPGLIESADGGTLFLDEVAEQPLATQAKLLRVLESREATRLGSVKPTRVDVRFLAATNRDLRALVGAGTFRADLYFRLNGIAITIPPLRERRAEIGPLAAMFIAEAAAQLGRPAPILSPEARALLQAYLFPGNVRELRNIAERAVLLSPGDVIGAPAIVLDSVAIPLAEPSGVGRSTPSDPGGRPTMSPLAAPPVADLRGQLDEFERERIAAALEQCKGNQSRAAEVLGISRRTLLKRLDAFVLPRPRKGK